MKLLSKIYFWSALTQTGYAFVPPSFGSSKYGIGSVVSKSSLFSKTDGNINLSSAGDRILAELKEASDALSVAYSYISKDPSQVTPEDIVKLCDAIDDEEAQVKNKDEVQLLMDSIELKKKSMEFGRYHLLVKLMKKDYDAYVATAGFLSPSRIPRLDLPNVQDVPFNDIMPSKQQDNDTNDLVDDCTLENKTFDESPLDKLLLKIFRDLVEQNTGGISSPKKGINGLLDQGRTFMLQEGQSSEAQHKMVRDTLGGLMTPVLPPFYRIFMSGIVPQLGTDWDGKQLGPWFYVSFELILLFHIHFFQSIPLLSHIFPSLGSMAHHVSYPNILWIPCGSKPTKSSQRWRKRRFNCREM